MYFSWGVPQACLPCLALFSCLSRGASSSTVGTQSPPLSPVRRRSTRGPPPPPRKRQRTTTLRPPCSPADDPSQSPPARPGASSTMRSEYDLVEERPKIVLHISKSKYLPKQPIKRARMSGSLGKICYHCEETVSNMDINTQARLD